MTDTVQVVLSNEVTMIEEVVENTDILIESDEAVIVESVDETVIDTISVETSVILEATVVNVGGGSEQTSGFSFFPSGW